MFIEVRVFLLEVNYFLVIWLEPNISIIYSIPVCGVMLETEVNTDTGVSNQNTMDDSIIRVNDDINVVYNNIIDNGLLYAHNTIMDEYNRIIDTDDGISHNNLSIDLKENDMYDNDVNDSTDASLVNTENAENPLLKLKMLGQDTVDIIIISETKIDDSFPCNQFRMEGYQEPFRIDRNLYGGGIILFIRDGVSCKEMKNPALPSKVEGIFIELNLRKTKWVLTVGYNPRKENISYFLDEVSKVLDKHIINYDNLLVIGDFNCTISEVALQRFCEIYDLENLIKQPTCYKNPINPTSIDLILTNGSNNFHNSTTVETGLSDHHKMTLTVLKTYVKKKDPITVSYRCYKKFNETLFRSQLIISLQRLENNVMNYDKFKKIFMFHLNEHAPMKRKLLGGNNAPFMNKTLSKAFMHRAKLKNSFNKAPSEYNKNYIIS